MSKLINYEYKPLSKKGVWGIVLDDNEELEAMLNMINSAQLPERRVFNSLKEQIKDILSQF